MIRCPYQSIRGGGDMSKKWGYGLLATSVMVNAWAWHTLGLVEMLVPWIPLEIFTYYIVTTKVTFFVPKLPVFLLSTFLTFICLQQYIVSDDVKMQNEAVTVDSSEVQMKVTKARMDVVEKTQPYESIDPVYLRTKETLLSALSDLKNKRVTYKGKTRKGGLWLASGHCRSTTGASGNIAKRWNDSCSKIEATTKSLASLVASYNSDARKQSEMVKLAASYASYSRGRTQDTTKNIKKLAISTVYMVAPLLGVENIEQNALRIADNSLVFLSFLIASVLSGTVLVAGLGDSKIKNSVSILTENARNIGNRARTARVQLTGRYPFALVLESNVDRTVNIAESTNVGTGKGTAFRKNLVKTLKTFTEGEIVTRGAIRMNCKCGNNIATAIFKTLNNNDLLTDDSKWKHPTQDA
jgi:hypothetical protein